MISFQKIAHKSKECKCVFCGSEADYLYGYTTTDLSEDKTERFVANYLCDNCNKVVKYILGKRSKIEFYTPEDAAHISMQKVIDFMQQKMPKDKAFKTIFQISYDELDKFQM